jgi:hypothetical protein
MHQGGQLQLGYIRTRPAHRHQAGREVSSHNARCWTTWETCRVCSAQRAEKHDGGRAPSVSQFAAYQPLLPLCAAAVMQLQCLDRESLGKECPLTFRLSLLARQLHTRRLR